MNFSEEDVRSEPSLDLLGRLGDLEPGRIGRAARIITSFFLGQGALQGMQVLTTLFLMRWLTVEEWAQYGLVIGFQISVGALMDLGISTTIVPLVGARREDKKEVGKYVRAARQLRDRTFLIFSPLISLAFFAITYRHHWGWKVEALLLASILLTLYSTGRMAYFSAPLLLFGKLREFYLPQAVCGFFRFVIYGACKLAGLLNAWLAAALFAVSMAINGIVLRKEASPFFEWPPKNHPSAEKEVIHYILPAVPAIIFAAFQAQISVFLISIFGSTESLAQVAALSKISQIFSILMTFNVVVVEPYMARLQRSHLASRYFGFAALGGLICTPVVLIAFVYPAPFLWILGPKYAGLGAEIRWIVSAACINYLAGLMWIMNRSRKWVFWRGTILEICLVLVVQTAFAVLVGVRTTSEAVQFTFVTSFCYLATHGYIASYGFRHGPRNTGGGDPVTSEGAPV